MSDLKYETELVSYSATKGEASNGPSSVDTSTDIFEWERCPEELQDEYITYFCRIHPSLYDILDYDLNFFGLYKIENYPVFTK